MRTVSVVLFSAGLLYLVGGIYYGTVFMLTTSIALGILSCAAFLFEAALGRDKIEKEKQEQARADDLRALL